MIELGIEIKISHAAPPKGTVLDGAGLDECHAAPP
jgi:hypothetical protein